MNTEKADRIRTLLIAESKETLAQGGFASKEDADRLIASLEAETDPAFWLSCEHAFGSGNGTFLGQYYRERVLGQPRVRRDIFRFPPKK